MLSNSQRAARQSGLGGSDIAALLGMDHRKTPVQLWMEKTGQIEPPDLSDNEAVYWGNVFEPIIATEYAKRTGRKVRRVNRTLRHPKFEWRCAHIDRDILKEPGGLEIKKIGEWVDRDLWGQHGSDEVPYTAYAQSCWYMHIRNAPWWDIAGLRGGNQFAIYTIHRDMELESEIVRRATEFWQHVQDRTPPPPINADDLVLLYPRDTGSAVVADEEIAQAHHDLIDIKAQLKELEQEKDVLEFQIKLAMDEHGILLDATGATLATWKAQFANRFNQKTFAHDYPELFQQYKTESTNRVFRLKGL